MKIKDLIDEKLFISVSKFAKEIGLSRQTIINIKNDKYKTLSLLTIKKICKYFNVDPKDYMD